MLEKNVTEFAGFADHKIIIVLKPGTHLAMRGAFSFLLLGGTAIVNGYELKSVSYEQKFLLNAAAPEAFSLPLLLEVPSATSHYYLRNVYKHTKVKYRLKEVTPHYEEIAAAIGDSKPAILYVDKTVGKVEAMLAEQVGPNFLLHAPRRMKMIREYRFDYELTDFFPYTDESVHVMIQTVDRLMNDVADGHKIKIMPMGMKAMGKSTLMRCLINLFMSRGVDEIYVLDADPGQTEFTPPGCMSLVKVTKPIFDCNFSHMLKEFPCTYFTGVTNIEGYTELYKGYFSRLYQKYQSESSHGSVLLVNTMGWIDGTGHELLTMMHDLVRPQWTIGILRDRQNAELPRVYNTPDRGFHSVMNVVDLITQRSDTWMDLTPAGKRAMTIMGYFGQVLPTRQLSSILEVVPYEVEFSAVTLVLWEDHSFIKDTHVLAAFNTQLVAICESIDAESRQLCGSDKMPKICSMGPTTELGRCIAFGIIRCISIEKRKLFITSPADLSEISFEPIIVKGRDVHLPKNFLTSPAQKGPYVSLKDNKKNAELMDGLYGELHLVTKNLRSRR